MRDSGSTRNYYGIGLPELSANIALRRLPWQVEKTSFDCIFCKFKRRSRRIFMGRIKEKQNEIIS